jgi:hypothetical protein
MLKENKALRRIMLGHNPIGQRGGRAIIRAVDRMINLGITVQSLTVRSEKQKARRCE